MTASATVAGADARAARAERVRERMAELGVEALLLSLGADLPWLTGYEAMPLERLTMLVFPGDGRPTLVVPRLEEPRVEPVAELFDVKAWDETDHPVAIVADLLSTRGRGRLAISDQTWATFVLQLQNALPKAEWLPASQVTSALRAVKDAEEVGALSRAAAAADRVAARLMAGKIPLVGRTEAEVARDIGDALVDEGHARVAFCIVASGPNAASPHHEPGERRIGYAESVVCDFGGVLDGYCSDITRTVFTGTPPEEFVVLYSVLQDAQAGAVASAEAGTPCEEVDATARRMIEEAGYGEYFVHRTGHGIGLEVHENPYLVAGNAAPLVAGNAFSVEPGIYLPGRWGARIEDIVLATEDGPHPLNAADHSLAIVGA